MPDGPFEVVGAGDVDRTNQSFQAGALSSGAVELASLLLPRDRVSGRPRVVFCCCMPPSRAQATSIRDPDQELLRSSGWYAEIRSARAEISLHSDAIHESILVFPYSRSKRHFYLDRSLELTVGLPPPAKPVHHQS